MGGIPAQAVASPLTRPAQPSPAPALADSPQQRSSPSSPAGEPNAPAREAQRWAVRTGAAAATAASCRVLLLPEGRGCSDDAAATAAAFPRRELASQPSPPDSAHGCLPSSPGPKCPSDPTRVCGLGQLSFFRPARGAARSDTFRGRQESPRKRRREFGAGHQSGS